MEKKRARLRPSGEPSAEFQKEFVIEYAETDKMGVLHNARYSRLFEETLTDWLRALGTSVAYLEQLGICLPVRESRLKYLAPIRLEDHVRVVMRAYFQDQSPLIRFEFNVYLGKKLTTRATYLNALCKRDTRADRANSIRLIPIPAHWLLAQATRFPR